MSDDFVRQNSADQDKKLDAEKLRVNGLDVYRLRTTSGPMAVRLDQADAATLYVGEALPGASPADPVWRIRKLLTTGAETAILYANGDSAFTNIWDNRASFTYS